MLRHAKKVGATLAALALIGGGCSGAPAGDNTGSDAADEGISGAAVSEMLTSAGIEFTEQDDTAKRASVFSAGNQEAIEKITKHKFGSSSIQLTTVDLNDASRANFVDADLLSLYTQVQAADAAYQRDSLLSSGDDDTLFLMIYKAEDKDLAKSIGKALGTTIY